MGTKLKSTDRSGPDSAPAGNQAAEPRLTLKWIDADPMWLVNECATRRGTEAGQTWNRERWVPGASDLTGLAKKTRSRPRPNLHTVTPSHLANVADPNIARRRCPNAQSARQPKALPARTPSGRPVMQPHIRRQLLSDLSLVGRGGRLTAAPWSSHFGSPARVKPRNSYSGIPSVSSAKSEVRFKVCAGRVWTEPTCCRIRVQRHSRVVGLDHAPPHERRASASTLILRVDSNKNHCNGYAQWWSVCCCSTRMQLYAVNGLSAESRTRPS